MAAEIFTAISALRMVLDSETDADSPDNETTFAAIRVAIESLFLILLGTGVDGTVTTIAETVLTDTGGFVDSAHLEHTLLMTSGDAKGNMYTIDSNTTTALTCTGDTMSSDGVAIGDYYVILYDCKTSTGHTHDAKNARNIDLADDSVDSEHYAAVSIDTEHYALESVGYNQIHFHNGNVSASLAGTTAVAINMQDYCSFPSIYSTGTYGEMRLIPGGTAGATYTGRFGLYNTGVAQKDYTAYWRYVTASDEPFVYAIRDISTGKIIATWICDDPPQGYWGLDEKPDDFEPPIINTPALTNVEEIVLFKYPKSAFDELIQKPTKDKVFLHELITTDYDYDLGKKLFVTKNLATI